ncbi:hypothetical protein Hanom_Chr11g00984771 [Helianthus anomalus]
MSAKIPEAFDLEELDNYSGPVQVKKEQSPKATTSSKPTSSKAVVIPNTSPATKTRASSARKRKETNSPTTPDTFPYENHGLNEASGFMLSFLNQVKSYVHLMHLYEEACGLNKLLESKLNKAEVSIVDQGMIATAKSQYYEDKFKVVTQEAQTAIKKANWDAHAKMDASQLQHEQDMNSY